MKIAVTYENGLVFQHFGHTQQFKLYTVENGKITSSEVVDTNGSGHGALAVFLKTHGVDTLICGGIGGGARTALAEAGIALYPGARGAADAQAEALLAGTLAYDPDTTCAHHEHHGEGHEGCHGHHGEGHTLRRALRTLTAFRQTNDAFPKHVGKASSLFLCRCQGNASGSCAAMSGSCAQKPHSFPCALSTPIACK